jgi:photosystem II stability/assembly factor-like uncharacterized protein
MSDWMEQSGERNEEIHIKKIININDIGGSTLKYSPIVDTLWAKRHFNGGSEKDTDAAEVAIQKVVWHVNYYEHKGTAINPADFEIRHKEKVYDIIQVKEKGFNKTHELYTVESDINSTFELEEKTSFLTRLTSYDSGIDGDFFDVTWSERLELYIAVGNGVIATSTDGVSWSEQSIPNQSASFRSISESDQSMIAVGVNTLPHRSTDGINWTQITDSPAGILYDVCFANNRYVAVGSGKVIYSLDDGINWSEQSIPNTKTWKGIVYHSSIGKFVSVSNSGGAMSSQFGNSSWTNHNTPLAQWESICYNEDNRRLVSVGYDGSIMYSDNISSWTLADAPNTNDYLDVLHDSDIGVYVAVSVNGLKQVIFSENGIDWSENPAQDSNNYITSICYSASKYKMVAVTDRSNGLFYKSTYDI